MATQMRQDDDETTSIRERKRQIRRAVLARRQALPAAEHLTGSRNIWQRLIDLDWYQQARVILGYMAIGQEVLMDGLLRQAIASRKQVILPVVQADRQCLALYAVQDIEHDVAPGYQGILEPQPTRTHAVGLQTLDLAIVPGVAFDMQGTRLGFGMGFYDRLLSQLHQAIPKIGLAFEFQVVPQLPRQAHDVRLDAIVTERRVIWCTPRSAAEGAAVARFTNGDGGRGEV
jgi:5-formyltetrahydrofolate cyclo-ligase